MTESDFIDPFIKSAERLGGLTPAAIFAFMWLWQAIKELKRENREAETKKRENERREQQILSTERNTEAYKLMAQNIIMLRDAHNALVMQVNNLATIIQERIK